MIKICEAIFADEKYQNEEKSCSSWCKICEVSDMNIEILRCINAIFFMNAKCTHVSIQPTMNAHQKFYSITMNAYCDCTDWDDFDKYKLLILVEESSLITEDGVEHMQGNANRHTHNGIP